MVFGEWIVCRIVEAPKAYALHALKKLWSSFTVNDYRHDEDFLRKLRLIIKLLNIISYVRSLTQHRMNLVSSLSK